MLLSFAQFEREVTAERIRDKIAASKAKGMWMGGVPPLGYEPDGRSLKIVEEHARMVRQVFDRYLELGNVRRVQDDLVQDGLRSPIRTTQTGKTYGGGHLSRGQIYSILKNPVHIGRIAHKSETFEGQHEAIVDPERWDRVQAKLKSNSAGKRLATRRNTSPLAGLLFTPDGEPLVPVHTTKRKKRYRYYVSRSQQNAQTLDKKAVRIPALELERLVLKGIQDAIADPIAFLEKLRAGALNRWVRVGRHSTEINPVASQDVATLVERIVVHLDHLTLSLDATAVAEWFGVQTNESRPAPIDFKLPCTLKRAGFAMRFVDKGGTLITQDQASSLGTAAIWCTSAARSN